MSVLPAFLVILHTSSAALEKASLQAAWKEAIDASRPANRRTSFSVLRAHHSAASAPPWPSATRSSSTSLFSSLPFQVAIRSSPLRVRVDVPTEGYSNPKWDARSPSTARGSILCARLNCDVRSFFLRTNVFIGWQVNLTFTFTFTFICHPGKTHNHRSRGDTPWRARTVVDHRGPRAAVPARTQCCGVSIFELSDDAF